MPDMWVDVDTAVIVPVNIMPLLDDTDFKSIETAVVFNSAGLVLTWNFVTSAGVVTGVVVTPTSAGVYDWSEPIADKGMYAIEIPASGGASINNDTEGFGWFTGVATGVLPWRGPVIGFRAAALNNSLVDAGTTGLLAPTVAARTLDVTATGEAGVDWANVGAPTTALDLSGTTIAPTQKVDVETIKTQAVTAAAPVTIPASLASPTNITGGTITTVENLTVNNDKTGYAIGAGGIAATSFAAGAIDAAAIAANAIGASELAADAANEIADALLARNIAGGSSAGRLVSEALYVLRNKVIIAAGIMTVSQVDDVTPAWTAAISTTAGDPISAIDPA